MGVFSPWGVDRIIMSISHLWYLSNCSLTMNIIIEPPQTSARPVKASYIVEGLTFQIQIKGERRVYGRDEVLIEPVSGSGTKWVIKSKVK